MEKVSLVQFHVCGGHAEVVVRDEGTGAVWAGNLGQVPNPQSYQPAGAVYGEEAVAALAKAIQNWKPETGKGE